MKIFLGVLVASLGLVSPSVAAGYAAMGAGTQTCGTFAEDYRKSPKFFESNYYSWAQGMMSGLNLQTLIEGGQSRNLAAKSTESQEAMIRSYCNAHPLAMYMDGVMDLYVSFPLNPKRKREP